MGGAVGRGRKTSQPGRVGVELGTPKWHNPFPLTGSPSPCAPPRPPTPPPTDCLTASTACLGSKKPTFLSPTWELGARVFLWKSFRREKENSESRHVVVCVGTGSFCLPPPPSALVTSRHTSSLDSLLSPPPLPVTQIPLPTVTVFSGRNKYVGTQLGG